MRKVKAFVLTALISGSAWASGQVKRTEVPLGDAVNRALERGSLTSSPTRPFHIKVSISEPENPQSPYQGTIEEWWVSSEQWRREVTAKGGMHQTIVTVGGRKTERDEGDYFPLWLRRFQTAIIDPIPDAAGWTKSGAMITQITMPNGDKSDACARAQSKIGSGDRATSAFSNVCFDGEGRLKFYGSPGYDMEFHDYRSFGKKQIAHKLVDNPEPGTKLVGEVVQLEDESKSNSNPDLFSPLPSDDNRFRTVQVSSEVMEKLTSIDPPILWPSVHSGNVRGRLAVYLSVDSQGQVREAWPLNSDNAGLQDSARAQVQQWKLKLATDETGKPVQVEGPLGFAFETRIEDPLPQLNNTEIRGLATKIVEPVWPTGSVTPGQTIEVEMSVNEEGKLTGMEFSKVPGALQGAIMNALRQWTFRPLIRNDKPQYFHGTLTFAAN